MSKIKRNIKQRLTFILSNVNFHSRELQVGENSN